MSEIAWAAGFFDGEGSTIAYPPDPKRAYLRSQASAPQHGGAEIPQVLTRFQRAVLDIGRIVGPDEKGMYRWETRSFEETQASIALVWRFLGTVKRNQAANALRAVVEQYRSGRIKARQPKLVSKRPSVGLVPLSPIPESAELERAWAAGFMDAEGCFGLARSLPRKGGAAWYRIRASASQNGEAGEPAEVLTRLQAVLGGIGRIERHGDPDDYKWLVEGENKVEWVLEYLRPWLGQKKQDQAEDALQRFRTQTRLKGDATRCVRGHRYTRLAVKGGRLRRICNPCERITDRMRRAALGIAPRQFKNVARRYTF